MSARPAKTAKGPRPTIKQAMGQKIAEKRGIRPMTSSGGKKMPSHANRGPGIKGVKNYASVRNY